MSPASGLHPRDNQRLLETLEQLRDMSNTVLVVEHDEETIRRADYVIDLGSRRGQAGWVCGGGGARPETIAATPDSLTGQIPLGRAAHPRAGQAAGRQWKVPDGAGGAGQQFEEH